MSKLAVILPYNEKHIKDFTEHFSAVVEQKGFYYKLVFVKQRISTRPQQPSSIHRLSLSQSSLPRSKYCNVHQLVIQMILSV